MATCNCKVYDGAAGPVRLVRKGGSGQNHRGWDIWRHPRTQTLDDVAVLAPVTVQPKFLGDGKALGGDSWTWGLMACMKMLDGPHPGLYLLMAHFNGINIMGTEGKTLPAGTAIGCEGWSGNTDPAGSGGKHLHVEVVDANYNPMPSSYVAAVLGFDPNATERQDYSNTFQVNQTPAPTDPFPGVSDEQLAARVWAGEFGNGDTRKAALGTRYAAVQTLVDRGVGKPAPADPFAGVSDEQLAARVWSGEFGNGDARKAALGTRYAAVQALVDQGVGKPAPTVKTHTVVPGDNLWNLAQQYGVNWNAMLAANSHFPDPNLIYPGDTVYIP